MPDIVALPNSVESLRPLMANGRIPLRRVYGMLVLRSAVSFGLLLVLAATLGVVGKGTPVSASAAWWLWFVTVANVVSLLLLRRFCRVEGMRVRDIFYLNKSTWKGDLVWALGGLAGIALFVQLPGTLLAGALWSDANLPNGMLFRPLPLWAVYPLFLLMPITQALAELPIYWGYVAPRLRASGMRPWLVIGLVGCVLSLQHLFFSFQLDWRYDLWLAVKFLPFALWTGFIVYKRPTTLPYLMGMHFLLDASLPLLLLMVSTGVSLVR